MFFRNNGFPLFLLIFLVAIGCSKDTGANLAPVSGQVVYKGVPVEGAQVVFSCDKGARAASGVTDGEGRFHLTTFEFKDGATVGLNIIMVTKIDPSSEASGNAGAVIDEELKKDPTKLAQLPAKNSGGKVHDMMKARDVGVKHLVPAKYSDGKRTPLKEEVTKAGPNKFVLQLTD